MAQPERGIKSVPALPSEVEIDPANPMPPHSSAEITRLKEITGKRYMDLMGEGADDGERFQVIVWLTLRRLGFDPSWEEAGGVLIKWVGVMPDPMSGATTMSLPGSAGSGAAPPETLMP